MAEAAVLSASICSCFLQTELLSSSWYSLSFSFNWLSSLETQINSMTQQKAALLKVTVNPCAFASSTCLKMQKYLKGTPKSPVVGFLRSHWGGNCCRGRGLWGSWAFLFGHSLVWESSLVCLLAPPAGQEQEQLECLGLCDALLDYCPPPQMRTAAGVSALKHREEGEERKLVETQIKRS